MGMMLMQEPDHDAAVSREMELAELGKDKMEKKHQEQFLEVFREIKVEKYASIYQDREKKNTKKGFVVQSTGMCVV